jgi:hypothetical protein
MIITYWKYENLLEIVYFSHKKYFPLPTILFFCSQSPVAYFCPKIKCTKKFSQQSSSDNPANILSERGGADCLAKGKLTL